MFQVAQRRFSFQEACVLLSLLSHVSVFHLHICTGGNSDKTIREYLNQMFAELGEGRKYRCVIRIDNNIVTAETPCCNRA